ncbi:MAG: hypothetical protein Q4C06_02460 [Bacillota bacterium]|nr:hypothetical protein [Bacillota bacterium]
MAKKQSFTVPVVGGSSLLVIFAVLCMTVFALLSLSTVLANGRLNQASVDAVSEYYAADAAAEEIFARLRQGEMPEGVTEENGIYEYRCDISENQTLQVKLQQTAAGWQVLRWQAVVDVEWEEGTLDLWDGEL